MTATYSKLKSGEWGIRIVGTARPGDIVTVQKKSGETREERVGKVIWTGSGVTLATIGSGGNAPQSPQRYSQYPRTGCSCGSREGIIQASDCWTCKHDAE